MWWGGGRGVEEGRGVKGGSAGDVSTLLSHCCFLERTVHKILYIVYTNVHSKKGDREKLSTIPWGTGGETGGTGGARGVGTLG